MRKSLVKAFQFAIFQKRFPIGNASQEHLFQPSKIKIQLVGGSLDNIADYGDGWLLFELRYYGTTCTDETK
ncbi:hypothetical protein E4U13_004044 [Claviceps humidiphila]|uniref:Uncharacterized protein n=1 Tax=Claviceps humidiphila TaxID=1294629 RepID=A0A9P7TTD7_9HYPO|nr:hypothetical protein E4U13_004044 [Claviceps humidiphila]